MRKVIATIAACFTAHCRCDSSARGLDDHRKSYRPNEARMSRSSAVAPSNLSAAFASDVYAPTSSVQTRFPPERTGPYQCRPKGR